MCTYMLAQDANKNAISIAFGIERNSAMDRSNLADLTAFVAVADRLSFRAAASQLGVSPSALSHSMRQPGASRRALTAAHDAQSVAHRRRPASARAAATGKKPAVRNDREGRGNVGIIRSPVRASIDQIAGALENLNQERQRPMGRLRIYAIPTAAAAIVAPIWVRFSCRPTRMFTWSSRLARRRSTSGRRDSTPELDRATGRQPR
jgi:hypothetical protein